MNQSLARAEPSRPTWADSADRLSPRDFQRLAAFIQDYSGIKMPVTKQTMVEGRLRKRVRALELESLSDYCSYLFERDGLASEEIHLIDAVTTNKTEFFREPEHFRQLADSLLPGIESSRRVSSRAPVKIWSAAASTGAEAYTIAMVLAEFERHHPDLASVIFATDICTEVLRKAQLGIYPTEMLVPVPAELQARYVMRARDRRSDLARIVPELRAKVRFARLNLMERSYPMDRDMDLVFCRNILIYFDKPTQLNVLRSLCDHIRPGGHLILGHSESLSGFDLPVRAVKNMVFQRE